MRESGEGRQGDGRQGGVRPAGMVSAQQGLQRRIRAARGELACDVLLRGVRYLDVFSACFRQGDVALYDGVVVGLEGERPAARVLDAQGRWLVPGFVDAHVHVESSLMLPGDFAQAVLARGTTTVVCDPHEIANVVGLRGLRYFLETAEQLPLDMRVMLSSCVPATHLETNGAGTLSAEDLLSLRGYKAALGLAEVMNIPGVLHGDAGLLAKLAAFADSPIDGHCPLVGGKDLSACAVAGLSSCHESSGLEEARAKLQRGLAVWIREGSVAKDLEALVPLLTLASGTSIGFCTDDRNPFDLAEEGHIDHLIRGAIAAGVAPEVAYRSASWTPARHYGLSLGSGRIGAVAPGYRADLVLLADARSCAVEEVFCQGQPVSELAQPTLNSPDDLRDTMHASLPLESELLGPSGSVRVIGVHAGKLLTEHRVMHSGAPEVCRLSVLERHGGGQRPANGYVTGFGVLRGAIASSVGHDSHNLIVVGHTPKAMCKALGAVIDSGGGFSVATDGGVAAHMALPFGGLMSSALPGHLRQQLALLRQASRAIGCALPDPFLQLAFLSLPVIPSLKLTNLGLVDVDGFDFIDVRAA